MDLATRIARDLTATIDRSLADGGLEAANVRRITVSFHAGKLLLSLDEDWDNYPEPSLSSAIPVPLDDWLAAVDRLDPPSPVPPQTPGSGTTAAMPITARPALKAILDGHYAALRAAVRAALLQVAAEPRWSAAPCPPAVWEYLFTSCNHATVIGFCHAQGHGELLPVKLEVDDQEIQGWATPTSTGFTIFVTQGEGDPVRRLDLTKIAGASEDSGDFKLRDATGSALTLTNAYCPDEGDGFLSQKDVRLRLRQHIAALLPSVRWFDRACYPPLAEAEACLAWERNAAGTGLRGFPKCFEVACAAGGLPAARRLAAGVRGDAALAKRADGLLINALDDAGAYAEELALIRLQPEADRKQWATSEINALLALGDAAAALPLIEAQVPTSPTWWAVQYRGQALVMLGRHSEAAAGYTAKVLADSRASLFPLAAALHASETVRALQILNQALAKGEPSVTEQALLDGCPSLATMLAIWRAILAQRQGGLAAVVAARQSIAPLRLPFDRDAAEGPAVRSWEATTEAKRSQGKAKRVALAAGRCWAACGKDGLVSHDAAQPDRMLVIPDTAGCRGLAVAGERLVLACGNLRVMGVAAERPDPTQHWSPGGGSYVTAAADGNLIAAAGGSFVDLWRLVGDRLEYLASIGCPDVCAVELRDGWLWISASANGLVVVDVHDPAHPRVHRVLTGTGETFQAWCTHLLGDLLAIDAWHDGWWLVDNRDPAAPVVIAAFPQDLNEAAMRRDGDRIRLATTGGQLVTIDVSDRLHPRVVDAEPLGEAGVQFNLALLPIEQDLTIINTTGCVRFTARPRTPTPASQDDAQTVNAIAGQLGSWVETCLRAAGRDDWGLLLLSAESTGFKLSIAATCSIPAIDRRAEGLATFTLGWDAFPAQAEALARLESSYPVWQELFSRTLPAAVSAVRPGRRTVLATNGNEGSHLLDVMG